MTFFGNPPRADIDWARALEDGRRRAQAAAAAWDRAQVAHAADIARAVPWLPPGVALALAKGNADPSVVHEAAAAGAAMGAGLPPFGTPVPAHRMVPGDRELFAQADPRDRLRAQREAPGSATDPSQMRSPMAPLMADLGGKGLLEDGALRSPVGVRGEYDLDEYVETARDPENRAKAELLVEVLRGVTGEDPLSMVDADGNEIIYFPDRGVVAPRSMYEEAQPRSIEQLAATAMRGAGTVVPPAVGEFLANRHMPTIYDAPGVRDTAPAQHVQATTAGLRGVGTPREVIQTNFMALNAPIQEFTGQIRNVYGAVTGRPVDWWEPQSDFLISMGDDSLEPGDGIFVDPDESLAQERVRREAERGQIYGENITLGRIVTGGLARAGVIEPGDTPYRVLSGLVDGALQLADPTAAAAGGVARASLQRTIFAAADEATELAVTSTPKLRALAASFEIAGRSRMAREELIEALGRVDLSNASATRLRNLAASFNIAGRSRMNKADLAAALRTEMSNLGATTTRPGEIIQATPRPVGFALGMAEASRVTGIPQLLQRTGIIKGSFTRGVHGPSRDAWLMSDDAAPLLQEIADSDNGAYIWRLTNTKLNGPELRPLIAARTTDEARDALRPLLGEQFRTTQEVWRRPEEFPLIHTPVPFADEFRDSRALSNVPGSEIDVEDPQSGMREMEAWFRNAHAPDEVVDDYVNRMIMADGYDAQFEVVTQAMEETRGILASAGVESRALRRAITNAYRREVQFTQDSFISEIAEQQSLFDDVTVGGDAKPVGGPFLWGNAYQRYIYLPDFRQIRRLTSDMPNIGWTADGKLRKPTAFITSVQEDIWKPFTLLRGAWPVRVIGEEQVRMGASNLASMFRDPLSYVAYVIGRTQDATGADIRTSREFQEVIVTRSNGFLTERPGRVRTGRQVPLEPGDKGYVQGWAETIGELHNQAVSRKLAELGSIDETLVWLRTTDEGIGEADKLRRLHPEIFTNDAAFQRYVETAAYWNDYMTGGNTDLLEAIRTGVLPRAGRRPGSPLLNPDGQTITAVFQRRLRNDYGSAGPAQVLGEVERSADEIAQRGAVVERMFGYLMAKPTSYLSRSPAFRQFYQQRVAELVGFGTEESKAAILDVFSTKSRPTVRRRELPIEIREAPKEIRDQIARTEAKGRLTVEEIDTYAKGWALDQVQELLYDLSRRSQIADSSRLVAPFAEAWREVFTRWASLANPTTARGIRNLRRFQQVIAGARGEDFGEVMGAPVDFDGNQRGFFWKDEFGEEVFLYPGTQWLTGNVTGATGEKVPVPMVGRVQGLSMFGEIIPGIGPAAALPVAWILNSMPPGGGTDWLRDRLLPYGSIMDEQGASAITQVVNYAPPWMRRGAQALTGGGYDMESNRLWANTIMSTANYLYSTGKYDISTEDGQARLLADAEVAARTLYGVRAFVGFGAPSAPSFDWLTETDEGTVRFAFLRDEYYRLVEDEGYESADEIFLSRFGQGAGLVMQAHTREVAGGIEPTEDFANWARSNGDLRTDLPSVWGFFGPGGGEFDYNTYVDQIAKGEREQLTPEEWLNLGDNHLGQMLLDRLLARLGPESQWTEADREAKRTIERAIAAEYPGFRDFTGTEQRADFADQILPELAEAVEDDRVLETQAGQGLALYWRARARVVEYATEVLDLEGIDRAEALVNERASLFRIGEAIARQYPDFARLWDRHLSHEVEPEEEV